MAGLVLICLSGPVAGRSPNEPWSKAMQARRTLASRGSERGVDSRPLLTGRRIGLAADLLRLGMCRARAALRTRRAEHCADGQG
jgi:hypothetical protein